MSDTEYRNFLIINTLAMAFSTAAMSIQSSTMFNRGLPVLGWVLFVPTVAFGCYGLFLARMAWKAR